MHGPEPERVDEIDELVRQLFPARPRPGWQDAAAGTYVGEPARAHELTRADLEATAEAERDGTAAAERAERVRRELRWLTEHEERRRPPVLVLTPYQLAEFQRDPWFRDGLRPSCGHDCRHVDAETPCCYCGATL